MSRTEDMEKTRTHARRALEEGEVKTVTEAGAFLTSMTSLALATRRSIERFFPAGSLVEAC